MPEPIKPVKDKGMGRIVEAAFEALNQPGRYMLPDLGQPGLKPRPKIDPKALRATLEKIRPEERESTFNGWTADLNPEMASRLRHQMEDLFPAPTVQKIPPAPQIP